MPKSDADYLNDLLSTRDTLLTKLAANKGAEMVQMGQKMVKYTDLATELEKVERMIAYYRRKTATKTTRRTNIARIHR